MSEEVQVDANLVVDILVNKIAKLEKAAAIAEAELISLRAKVYEDKPDV